MEASTLPVPQKLYVHWDNLLREMAWLANDFQKERLRHQHHAKKVCRAIEMYHKTKDVKKEKKVKDDELSLKRTAGKVAKEVRKFWLKINKVVTFKQKQESDEVRQKNMDKHLVYLVKQTERYTNMLTENMTKGGKVGLSLNRTNSDSEGKNSVRFIEDMSVDSLAMASDNSILSYEVESLDGEGGDDGDDDFHAVEEQDDETTLLEQEAREQGEDKAEEIAMLQKEASMSIEELRAMYANITDDEDEDIDDEDNDDEDEKISTIADGNEVVPFLKNSILDADNAYDDVEEQDDEFHVEDDEQDDETTLLEQEAKEAHINREEEIALLQKDGEIPIEQLRAMYSSMMENDSVDEGKDDDDDENNKNEDTDDEVEQDDDDDFHAVEEQDDETTLLEQEAREQGEDKAEEIAMLQKEASMSIEELRAMYANMEDNQTDDDEGDDDMDVDEHDDEDENILQTNSQKEKRQISFGDVITDADKNGEMQLVKAGVEKGDDALKRLEAADEEARSIYVELPFLLSANLKLREYQHVGLNWLVSLHERRLNGILADEMGLGKTIQTIALLAYLASMRGMWGPHLIVVPTSCIVNWEMEFKRWCPNFKVITYYGSTNTRKALRTGWSKLNSFHVCITSYQLVVQDSNAFRRKRWYYMILDEAHNIKNFKSQRWQTLLNFNTQRRLLLTGTPLQNNLMELWSLMHFLMPHIFRSRKEFSYWFSNPLSNMVEGNRNVNSDLISRLHGIMRPFLLRRLKKDVAKQLPGKHEHVVMCKLSKRQLFLYEEFMSRSSTRSYLSGGNFMGMMNILMQLRKVCNHPDLFEARAITSPFICDKIYLDLGALVTRATELSPLTNLSKSITNFWSYDLDSVSRSVSNALLISRDMYVMIEDVNLTMYSTTKIPAKFMVYLQHVKNNLQKGLRACENFNFNLSSFRCQKPVFGFDWRIVKSTTIDLPNKVAESARYDNRLSLSVASTWINLIKTVDQMVIDLELTIQRFVFVLPNAVSAGPQLMKNPYRSEDFVTEQSARFINKVRMALEPLYPIYKRQQIFFPDRKLVQFDSGKLQTLNVLLRNLKQGGHKCLIFTQMSKMLDILEVFLNLHGYTYVRLDGSTGVDKRQKLMDRFNSDPKLFVFILSTRSGGLGINLTGADTVIFYDSDWNPAMDAQAQDRAHRIGQTKEVHIYRLVCESTIEENILVKARQKRHLDYLVMTEGQFSETSLFSSQGLKDIFSTNNTESDNTMEIMDEDSRGQYQVPNSDIEAAMLAAEDDDDVRAMRGAKAEAAQDAAEFDGNFPMLVDEAEGDIEKKGTEQSNAMVIDTSNEEKDMEAEFASWQAKIGPDFETLQSALKSVERYALRMRTDVEPYYSIFYLTEQQRFEALQMEVQEGEKWDIEQIENEKEEEEYRALSEGELLAANLSRREMSRLRSWYIRERSQRNQERRRRLIFGEGWVEVIDTNTGLIQWYNEDTCRISKEKPQIVFEREAIEVANKKRFSGMPLHILIKIFLYLNPYPDRTKASEVCSSWHEAVLNRCFYKRVLSVESGSRDPTKVSGVLLPGTYSSIETAIKDSVVGDTIILSPGHHWESTLCITKSIRIIGEVEDLPRTVIELTGKFEVKGNATIAVLNRITIRRPKKLSTATPIFHCNHNALSIYSCAINNDGGSSPILIAENKSHVKAYDSLFTGGGDDTGIVIKESTFTAAYTSLTHCQGNGLTAIDSNIILEECQVHTNTAHAFKLVRHSVLALAGCDLRNNTLGPIFIDQQGETQPRVLCSRCSGDSDSNLFMSNFLWNNPRYDLICADEDEGADNENIDVESRTTEDIFPDDEKINDEVNTVSFVSSNKKLKIVYNYL